MVALTRVKSPRSDHNFGPDMPTAIAAIAPAITTTTAAIHQRSLKPVELVGAFATFAVPASALGALRLFLPATSDASSARAAFTGSRALTLSGVGDAMRSRMGAITAGALVDRTGLGVLPVWLLGHGSGGPS